ncbi:protein-(glutamine-N5) methyltransferase, release factor-specific [Flavobacterium branchiophilum NBRC 15030 = ATCC 35035]|uniref:Release factor glutamine methyltransferase n=1 Tax=Flavobacterium branchiophilum TaxID=55197 RepID=A0A543G4P2_9FLAO|nr:peptide chain release factor N(5)-glutamine methyltransferase [Flavobacterium branchiophilum]OXA75037.1 protein-(glutamine-N5) methyltransferase, release factor-specific [Flavobacterium branchiophilum NBRC 15030 = ATCC 35035]TQM41005.1 release factor glutamine methyltransferase [Flavobacterium branchiophilum]GEM55995.1 release factor glutamine methyltransferase [Flavobacterium branchiophilum NBRC 15030 = ATCC 35035]
MKIKEYQSFFHESLKGLYDAMEIEHFFYLILEQKRQLRRVDLALEPHLTFSAIEIKEWHIILDQLLQQKPIQYILGTTSFYGMDFLVNENVLIPRPETEELVDLILKKNPSKASFKILDVGTGSGCIAIALAKNRLHYQVTALDVSEKALTIAQQNATSNGVSIQFWHQNILDCDDLGQNFDIIVSNPPYVRQLEKAEMHQNVLGYEPALALFVSDEKPLVFYEKITQLAQKNLTPEGQLFFEINQYLGPEMVVLLEQYHFQNVTLLKDIYGNERIIYGTK